MRVKISGGYRLLNGFGNLMIDIVILEDCMIVCDRCLLSFYLLFVANRRGTFVGM